MLRWHRLSSLTAARGRNGGNSRVEVLLRRPMGGGNRLLRTADETAVGARHLRCSQSLERCKTRLRRPGAPRCRPMALHRKCVYLPTAVDCEHSCENQEDGVGVHLNTCAKKE